MKKTRVVLVGYGAMGKNVEELLRGTMDLELCAVVDRLAGPPCLPSLDAVTETFDVIVDFSHPDNLPMLAEYITKHGTPAVLCTTGYSPREDEQVAELAAHAPVLRSRNMSLGVCVMERVVRMVTPILAGFDIEIIERHHNRKIDAPSGTTASTSSTASVISSESVRVVLLTLPAVWPVASTMRAPSPSCTVLSSWVKPRASSAKSLSIKTALEYSV